MFITALFKIAQTGSSPHIHQLVSGQTVAHLCDGPLCSNTKEWTADTLYNRGMSQKHDTEGKKPDIKGYIVQLHFQGMFRKGNSRQTRRLVATWDWDGHEAEYKYA